MRRISILVVPDVHGRDFWMKPVEETLLNTDAQVVFLGDYLDPYPWEWETEDMTPMEAMSRCREDALNRFKEIIDLKKKYPERVTLLLGNHDCGYAIGSDICDCRTDYRNYQEIEYLFKDNRNLFQLAASSDVAGKKFTFSHAGILKGWADRLFDLSNDLQAPENYDIISILNNAWLTENYHILDRLAEYDGYRGWEGGQYGSPVWSDIRSWTYVTPEETFGYNIVGHTQLKELPVVLDQISCLDCRRCFFIDEDGQLRDYDSGEIPQKRQYPDDEWW